MQPLLQQQRHQLQRKVLPLIRGSCKVKHQQPKPHLKLSVTPYCRATKAVQEQSVTAPGFAPPASSLAKSPGGPGVHAASEVCHHTFALLQLAAACAVYQISSTSTDELTKGMLPT